MPNNVRNRLIIKADETKAKSVLDFLRGEPFDDGSTMYIDFNKIVPMPEELDIEDSSWGEEGMAHILSCQDGIVIERYNLQFSKEKYRLLGEEEKQKAFDLGLKYIANKSKYGHSTWLGWKREHWGTKWNAYSQSFESPNTIRFETAWNGVPALMSILSQKFPDVEFHYTYASEDSGYCVGEGTFLNGEGTMYEPEGQSTEAYNIYFELFPEDKEDFELTGSGWVYKNDEEE